jgi:hypothetical protein
MAKFAKLGSRVNPGLGHFDEMTWVIFRRGFFGPPHALAGELMELFCGHLALPCERRHPVLVGQSTMASKVPVLFFEACGNLLRNLAFGALEPAGTRTGWVHE